MFDFVKRSWGLLSAAHYHHPSRKAEARIASRCLCWHDANFSFLSPQHAWECEKEKLFPVRNLSIKIQKTNVEVKGNGCAADLPQARWERREECWHSLERWRPEVFLQIICSTFPSTVISIVLLLFAIIGSFGISISLNKIVTAFEGKCPLNANLLFETEAERLFYETGIRMKAESENISARLELDVTAEKQFAVLSDVFNESYSKFLQQSDAPLEYPTNQVQFLSQRKFESLSCCFCCFNFFYFCRSHQRCSKRLGHQIIMRARYFHANLPKLFRHHHGDDVCDLWKRRQKRSQLVFVQALEDCDACMCIFLNHDNPGDCQSFYGAGRNEQFLWLLRECHAWYSLWCRH